MSETRDIATFRAVVEGRVQGVGFRYFVQQKAQKLSLQGQVCNLPDGSVEVQARGERANLEALAAVLKRGPVLSRVKSVKMDWDIALEPTDGFKISR